MEKITKIWIFAGGVMISALSMMSLFPGRSEARDYLPFLEDGKEWVYGDSNARTNPPRAVDEWVQETLGKDTLIDNRLWRQMLWRFSSTKSNFTGETSTGFYFYEEDGAVYAVAGDENTLDFSTYSGHMDMNLEIGDRYLMSEVVKVDSIKVRGVVRKRITLRSRMELEPDAFFVEGIGPSSTAYASYMPGNVVRYLLWVKDKDGNVVFIQEDFRAPSYSENSGIENIESGNKVDDSIYDYDLYGHRVANPAPGTIYVRRGRKFVQPCSGQCHP